MKCNVNFLLESEEKDLYKELLDRENFDFGKKNISVSLNDLDRGIGANVDASSVVEMKIGVNAFMKSVEVIEKVLNLEKENEPNY